MIYGTAGVSGFVFSLFNVTPLGGPMMFGWRKVSRGVIRTAQAANPSVF
jgi:hypothetical protein